MQNRKPNDADHFSFKFAHAEIFLLIIAIISFVIYKMSRLAKQKTKAKETEIKVLPPTSNKKKTRKINKNKPVAPVHKSDHQTTENQQTVTKTNTAHITQTFEKKSKHEKTIPEQSHTLKETAHSREDHSSKEKKVNKTLLIQAILENKNKLKQEQELERIEKRRKEKEEREKEKLQRLKEKDEQHNQRTQNNNNDNNIVTHREPLVLIKKDGPLAKSLTQRKAIENAIFLVRFTFSKNTEHHDIEKLSFIYHLFRLFLYLRHLPQGEVARNEAVKLRTLSVHLLHKIDIDDNMILETKEMLKNFIHTHIKNIFMEMNIRYKDDKDLEELHFLCHSGNHLDHKEPIKNLNELPICKKLHDIEGLLNSVIDSPFQFHQWIKKMISSLNAAKASNSEYKRDALKSILLTLGHYCTEKKMNLGLNIYVCMFYDKKGQAKLNQFFTLCQEIRNTLAHEIVLIDLDKKINTLCQLAEQISPEKSSLNLLVSTINPTNTFSYQKTQYQTNNPF